jgi:hypothetical protein
MTRAEIEQMERLGVAFSDADKALEESIASAMLACWYAPTQGARRRARDELNSLILMRSPSIQRALQERAARKGVSA